MGVAACAAAVAVGAPLVSHNAEVRKVDEEYHASVVKLSIQLAGNLQPETQDRGPSASATSAMAAFVPVSYDLSRKAMSAMAGPALLGERADYSGRAVSTIRNLEMADDAKSELDCLAEAVYFEARSETTGGQIAVAEVVMNRVADSRFPNTVCGVVYQGQYRATGCQFTFTCDGSRRVKPRGRAWERARAVALNVRLGLSTGHTNSATHYHTNYVDPYWSAGMVKTKVIGSHIFYRFPKTKGEWAHARAALQLREQARQIGVIAVSAEASVQDEAPKADLVEIAADAKPTLNAPPPQIVTQAL